MPSPTTSPTASPAGELAERIAAQRRRITELEQALWRHGLDEALLAPYQAAYRDLERLIAEQGDDRRHKFVVVIPVADRPQHLKTCLDSLLELCRSFGYGGQHEGRYRKLAVLIADDSADPANIAGTARLAADYGRQGLAVTHFGPAEQVALLAALPAAQRAALARQIGAMATAAPGQMAYRGHKGQGAMRNLAYLKLVDLLADEAEENLLFYSVDSDQEFRVKVATATGDREVCAVNFLHDLDRIFSESDALMLTGKVVGDPPVSPAVMAGNFLADAIGFVIQMAAGQPHAACRHHQAEAHREGEAAYHDMAELFGFPPAHAAYRYRCTLTGAHREADCFAHFAQRLGGFFFGEHPTRVSYYLPDDALRSVRPARTVYAGNYVFRPAALRFCIPFAALRLRMSGPTLGRLVKAAIGKRFVSANLPMLHKRTIDTTGQAEFRPGIRANAARAVELCGEFERQFFGDVMLFTIERLTAKGFPDQASDDGEVLATIEAVRADLLRQYRTRRTAMAAQLDRLRALLSDPAQWWNRSTEHARAVDDFRVFADNVAHNFGEHSPCHERIDSPDNWWQWRGELLAAIEGYPDDMRAWQAALATRRRPP
jgi:hypothetical protein